MHKIIITKRADAIGSQLLAYWLSNRYSLVYQYEHSAEKCQITRNVSTIYSHNPTTDTFYWTPDHISSDFPIRPIYVGLHRIFMLPSQNIGLPEKCRLDQA